MTQHNGKIYEDEDKLIYTEIAFVQFNIYLVNMSIPKRKLAQIQKVLQNIVKVFFIPFKENYVKSLASFLGSEYFKQLSLAVNKKLYITLLPSRMKF